MIDSHTHLDHAADPSAWIAAAASVGVEGMVSIGCGADSIRATLDIARSHPACVRIAAGVHPQSAATFDLSSFDEVADLARDPLVVGIGETGFDQFRDYGPLARQQGAFELQCELARELRMPLIIHSRAAELHTIDALERHADDLDVVLHCFALSAPDHLAVVLEHDRWTCSFAGNLTYPSAGDLRDAVAAIPLHRLLVETDAPYLAPVPMRGRPNEPSFVQHTLQVLADVRGIDFATARRATVDNARRIFGWNPGG